MPIECFLVRSASIFVVPLPENGSRIVSPTNENILIESFNDHRIAMAFAILAMLVGKEISINNFESVAVSNPQFLAQINTINVD